MNTIFTYPEAIACVATLFGVLWVFRDKICERDAAKGDDDDFWIW